MRFNNTILLKTSYFLRKDEFRKILMTHLGLTSANVDKFLGMKTKILNVPRHQIIKNCLICQKNNVSVGSLEKLYFCLKMNDNNLRHRINVLKDMGVPVINMSQVNQIVQIMNTKVPQFKERVNIPAEQDIVTSIFGDEVPEGISQLKLSDDLTVRQYYQACLLHCKTRVFNLPYLDDEILLKSYVRIKSINLIAETLKLLRNDLQYDDKMIKKHPVVIIASVDNIRSLLSSFTDIAGVPIKKVLRKHPHMLFQDVDNIKRLSILFKQYEIPDQHVKNYMNIFLLNNEVFYNRIELIKRHPDLNIWYNHHRMLQIIHQIKKTKDRIKYVDIMDSLKWANPQVFLSSKSSLDKSVQTGIVSSKHNLKHVLLKELGVDNIDLLMRHQHWKMVSFTDIMQMLKYLKRHFTINEICPNIHIILYEQSEVKKVLANLKRQYSQNTKYSFTNSQYLALCLYMLEKDHNFTGDGIWSNEQNAKHQSLEERSIVEKSDNTSAVEDYNNNLNTEDNNDFDHINIHDKDVVLSNNTQV